MSRIVLALVAAAALGAADPPIEWHGLAAGAAPPERVVVLVHGLDEPGTIWTALAAALVADGRVVAELHYPNDQSCARSVDDVAARLGTLAASGVARVDLVAHSMGGLICRGVLADARRYPPGAPPAGMPAVDRFIMVATPNHGSQLARLRAVGEVRERIVRAWLGRSEWLDAAREGDGQAGVDLLPESAFLRTLPATAPPRTAIIAGDGSPIDAGAARAIVAWWREHGGEHAGGAALDEALAALAAGSGDGAVSLESTKLDGAERVVLHGDHLSLLQPLLPHDAPPAIPEIRRRLRD